MNRSPVVAVPASEILNFPAPPTVVARLVELLARDGVTGEEVAGTLALDAGMTARVLQLANSVALGGGSPVDSVPEAVLRVGVDGVRDLVFALAMVGAMRPVHFDYRPFWRHSLAVGCMAQVLSSLAPRLAAPVPEAYTAGLLHDIGMLVLEGTFGTRYVEVLAAARATSRPLQEVEHEILGTDHAVAGGRLVASWRFPAILVDAVRCHHQPWESERTITRLVHLADFACNRQGIHHGTGHFPADCEPRVWAELGIDPARLPELLEAVQGQLAQAEAVLAAG